MNKKIIILIAIVAIIVLAVFAFSDKTNAPQLATNTPGATSTTPTSTATSSTTASSTAGASSTYGTNSTSTGGKAISPFITMGSDGWQTYTGVKEDMIVAAPPRWSYGPGSPISMDNFSHHYADGIIPVGGAEIDMGTTTLYSSLEQLAAGQLSSATNITTSSVSVSGTMCAEYASSNTLAPTVPSKNFAVYCNHHGVLFEFYLVYRANDPQASEFNATFNAVLARVTFTN